MTGKCFKIRASVINKTLLYFAYGFLCVKSVCVNNVNAKSIIMEVDAEAFVIQYELIELDAYIQIPNKTLTFGIIQYVVYILSSLIQNSI